MDQNERPQYYEGQYLGAEDLAATVRYARVGQARHALGAHTWGIAIGLDLVERPLPTGDVEMVLAPGYGWDGIGRLIVALAPAKVGLTLFENIQGDTDATGVPIEIWLSYQELPARFPGEGFAACRDDNPYARVIESFRIEARRAPLADYRSVTVAARTIEAKNAVSAFNPEGKPLYDESVPYQEFPESGDQPRWRIFVGIVRWVKEANKVGRLIKRTDDDLNETRKKRRYIGAVAEMIQAPDGVLRLRDRRKNPEDKTLNFQPPVVKPAVNQKPDNDLVWVEGNLRVIGDARLVAGKLDYRVEKGGDGGVPVWLRRTDDAKPKKTTLEAAIGKPPVDTETRFAVSALEIDQQGNAKTTEKLTVVNDNDKDARVGVNAPDPSNTLQVNGPTGIRYGYGYVSGDDAWTSFAFNAYQKKGDTWQFPDAMHKSASIQMDDTGGMPNVRISTNSSGDPNKWDLRMIVKGDSGNVGVATGAPRARLEVLGGGDQAGTAMFVPDAAKGARVSHVHRDPTGDWYIRSAASNGKVILQDTGGNVAIGTTTPSRTLHVEGLEVHSGGNAGGFSFANRETPNFVGGPANGERWVWYASGSTARLWSGNDKMAITPAGNVGIGTATPGNRLQISGGGGVSVDLRVNGRVHTGDAGNAGGVWLDNGKTMFVGQNSTNVGFWTQAAGWNAFQVTQSGNVGIGTTNPSVKLDIVGDLHVTGNAFKDTGGFLWIPSDRALKKEIEPLEGALARALRLRGVTFAWREPEKHGATSGRYMGWVAQDVEGAFPEWVMTTAAGYKALNPIGFEALFVEALRELSTKCDRLEAEIGKLRAQIGAAGSRTAGRKGAAESQQTARRAPKR